VFRAAAFFSPCAGASGGVVTMVCEESCTAVESTLWAKANAAAIPATTRIFITLCIACLPAFRGYWVIYYELAESATFF
jgi:hypothetical protein